MSTFVLIHGAGDVGWHFHLVEAELRARGHDVVAPDLPADDESKTLSDYADVVVDAIGSRQNLAVVGHSFGAFTAPLVAERVSVDVLILLAGMIPKPGESPNDWWSNTDFGGAVAASDDEFMGDPDPFVSFYHDVPRALAEEAMSKERAHPSSAAMAAPWPVQTWPDVPTNFLLCSEDRFFPPEFFRRLAPDRLGIKPDEIRGSHCVALSRPKELADRLEQYAGTAQTAERTNASS